eukprot:3933994-Rhodomonas_salina.2
MAPRSLGRRARICFTRIISALQGKCEEKRTQRSPGAGLSEGLVLRLLLFDLTICNFDRSQRDFLRRGFELIEHERLGVPPPIHGDEDANWKVQPHQSFDSQFDSCSPTQTLTGNLPVPPLQPHAPWRADRVLQAIWLGWLCSGIGSQRYGPIWTTFATPVLVLNPLPWIWTLVPPAMDPPEGLILVMWIAGPCEAEPDENNERTKMRENVTSGLCSAIAAQTRSSRRAVFPALPKSERRDNQSTQYWRLLLPFRSVHLRRNASARQSQTWSVFGLATKAKMGARVEGVTRHFCLLFTTARILPMTFEGEVKVF